jgi:D-arabinose 5-phosphate isomerase GutQ
MVPEMNLITAEVDDIVAEIEPFEFYWSTGIGKSACASALFATELRTMGVPAAHLDGGNLLHGDIGGFWPGHALFIFSRSAKTEQLVRAAQIVDDSIGLSIYWITAEPQNVVTGRAFQYYDDSAIDQLPRTVAQVMAANKLAKAIAISVGGNHNICRWAHPENRAIA